MKDCDLKPIRETQFRLQLKWIADFPILKLEAQRKIPGGLQIRCHNLAEPFRGGARQRGRPKGEDRAKNRRATIEDAANSAERNHETGRIVVERALAGKHSRWAAHRIAENLSRIKEADRDPTASEPGTFAARVWPQLIALEEGGCCALRRGERLDGRIGAQPNGKREERASPQLSTF